MSDIQCVVVEDNLLAQNLVRKYFSDDRRRSDIPGVVLNQDLLRPIDGVAAERKAAIEDIVQGIVKLTGPMILTLDCDLGVADEVLRTEIRSSIETKIGRQLPGELERQMDGIFVAVEAISNKRLTPLLVVLATTHGKYEELTQTLEDFARDSNRSSDVRVIVAQPPTGFSAARRLENTKGVNAALVLIGQIFTNALAEYQKCFRPRISTFLELLDPVKAHGELQPPTNREACSRYLTQLLGLSQAEFEQAIWDKWLPAPKDAKETILKMGGGRNQLSVVSAWFYVLAAFLHSGDPRPWTDLFNSVELTDQRLVSCHLTPNQNEYTLRRTAQCFYEMCSALFANEEKQESLEKAEGPLEKVQLSYDGGFQIILRFDCDARDPSNPSKFSLVQQISRWRAASLNWPDSNELGKRATSQAMWRYWLACSLGDEQLHEEDFMGALGHDDIWMMNVLRHKNKRTEVVFRGRS